jgi:hypothetical protein
VIAFNSRLALRSAKWVGPAVIVLLWTAFTVASPGSGLSNAGNDSFMFIAIACWLTVGIGNIDDQGHRELLAAATGSPARLHRARAVTAFTFANELALIPTIAGLATAQNPAHAPNPVVIVITALLLQVAATAVGVAIGTCLHRPVVDNTGVALLVSIGAFVVLALLPPLQHVLRDLNDDRVGRALVAVPVAIVVALGAVVGAGALADRRN